MQKYNNDFAIAKVIKRSLDNLIDYCFENDKNKKQYKNYKLIYSPKKYSSMLGQYDSLKNVISVYDIEETDNVTLLLVSLHELSHHIQTIRKLKAGHQKDFYEIFKKLIDGAIKIGFMSKYDVINTKTIGTDKSKIIKIAENLDSKQIEKYPDEEIVFLYVKNTYNYFTQLLELGYLFSPCNNCFVKMLKTPSVNDNIEKIKLNEVISERSYIIKKSNVNKPIIRKKYNVILIPKDNSDNYKYKNDLKYLGFFWNREKMHWEKQQFEKFLTENEKNALKDLKISYEVK